MPRGKVSSSCTGLIFAWSGAEARSDGTNKEIVSRRVFRRVPETPLEWEG